MKIFIKIGILILSIGLISLNAAPYNDNGNGTLTDSATGLIWQKCSAGQGTTLGNCSTGTIVAYNWLNAIAYCEDLNLGGRTDWRLPNVNELRSLVDFTKISPPTIDSTIFPNFQSSYYWSSSTYGQSTSSAWYIFFYSGAISYYVKTNNYYVICITGP